MSDATVSHVKILIYACPNPNPRPSCLIFTQRVQYCPHSNRHCVLNEIDFDAVQILNPYMHEWVRMTWLVCFLEVFL